jgi:Holliday junction resolvase-like predicted endonuclease
LPELSFERGLIALLVVLLLLQTARLVYARGLSARRMERNRILGATGERVAERLLLSEGFDIVERQTLGGYHFKVDGEETAVNLRADFIVKKEGKVLLVEVKGGEESAKATVRGTRRQLLEYTLAFRIDGILLLDAARTRIIEVEFPSGPLARSATDQGTSGRS